MAESQPAGVRPTSARTEAFIRLADDHLDTAYRLARAILRDRDDAQDATHDAFVQAWRKWGTLRDPSRFRQWFERILVNICRDRLRSARSPLRDISEELAIADDGFSQSQDRDVLGAAIAVLSPEHRVVIALRYYRDLSVGQIAATLGVPEGTVNSRLHYALKHLHATVDAEDGRSIR